VDRLNELDQIEMDFLVMHLDSRWAGKGAKVYQVRDIEDIHKHAINQAAKIKELEQDKARLDWILDWSDGTYWNGNMTDLASRETIDKAMQD
jgi:hypothetical protein